METKEVDWTGKEVYPIFVVGKDYFYLKNNSVAEAIKIDLKVLKNAKEVGEKFYA